ncbi:NAD(P)/FAD-dependent oxidoreductase [Acuticoccus sp. I52.16.1]|uniref:dihydrolipoyl dehydrogenase family protein n=1 Tax=Acuticoccus sp. I52.16.1 TaxID=2928472 RepID=UPI001FD620BC|nr:FAD-dependent oxidoreductase [Acuticoccus sp. I52.16.1]UOM33460.1 FAD-dependent oxidoreductase [Acuticoccus sp. I52.16.1]
MSDTLYDICVVGAGSAGLTVAAAAATFGQRVVLVERGKMGGDCLNYGCVPSKALIAAAAHAHAARAGAPFGVHATPQVDYAAVHAHVHGVIAGIAPHDSVERFEGLGVTVIQADARFTGPDVLEAGGRTIRARRFVIATGSSPVVPPIEGLAACDPLTNETLFDLTALPARLAIIGGGPIGCEMAQALQRLGAAVTVVEGAALLGREDPDAAAVVREALSAEGVRLIEGTGVARASREGEEKTLHLADGRTVTADAVLVAVGRRPNLDLGLEAAGVAATAKGITVDKRLTTSNRRIFAIGDVTGGLQFTHVAGHQASLAVKAIVFRLPVTYDPALMPRCTYTSPEVAQVGLTEAEARAADPKASVWTAPLSGNDRARAEGATAGFVKLVLSGRGKLMGATVVAPTAGDIIATYALALAAKVKPATIASFTPAYPTLSEAGKRAATSYFGEKLDKPWVRKVLGVLKRL